MQFLYAEYPLLDAFYRTSMVELDSSSLGVCTSSIVICTTKKMEGFILFRRTFASDSSPEC